MNISLQKLLAKMEEELRLARAAGTEAGQREKIHSIKTLCELVLEEPPQADTARNHGTDTVRPVSQAVPQSIPSQPYIQPQMPVSQSAAVMPQPKKLVTDDHANGDSLFDF